MKKKLLLLALPALMVMSSCTYMESATNLNVFDFKEEAVAHEELFGESSLLPRRLGEPGETPEPGSGFTKVPKVGVQYQSYPKDVDPDPDKEDIKTFYAVRYVAEINTTFEGGVKATWTRGASNYYGTSLKTLATGESFESKVLYTSLKSNGVLTPVEEGYSNYVVYTMYDIPAEQAGSYFVAYLTLSKAGEADVVSKAVVTRISGGNVVSYDSNKSGFFLAGSINGEKTFDADVDKRGDENAASFTTDFRVNDKFIIIQREGLYFKVWDGNCLSDVNADAVKDSGMVKFNTAAYYVIYLNGSNNIYHSKYRVYNTTGAANDFYVRGDAAGGWANSDCTNDYRFVTDPDNKAILLGVELTVGNFKISDIAWDHQWGYYQCKDGGGFWNVNGGNSLVIGGAASNFDHEEGKTSGDCNIYCKVAGTYNIYLTNNWFVSDRKSVV